MQNWPGSKLSIGAPSGASRSVAESRVSHRRETTRYGTGIIGSRSTVMRARIQIQQARSGVLQPCDQLLDEAERQVVAEARISVGLRAEHFGVELVRRDGVDR